MGDDGNARATRGHGRGRPAERRTSPLAVLACAFAFTTSCTVLATFDEDERRGAGAGDAGAYDAHSTLDGASSDSGSGQDASTTSWTQLRLADFENGLAVDPVRGADLVNGPVFIDTMRPIAGSASAFSPPFNEGYAEIQVPLHRHVRVEWTMRFMQLPGRDARILRVSGGGDTQVGLELLQEGQLELRYGSDSASSDLSPVIPFDTLIYIAVEEEIGAGGATRVAAYVSVGTPGFGAPFATGTVAELPTGMDTVRIGATNGRPIGFGFDDWAILSAD